MKRRLFSWPWSKFKIKSYFTLFLTMRIIIIITYKTHITSFNANHNISCISHLILALMQIMIIIYNRLIPNFDANHNNNPIYLIKPSYWERRQRSDRDRPLELHLRQRHRVRPGHPHLQPRGRCLPLPGLGHPLRSCRVWKDW